MAKGRRARDHGLRLVSRCARWASKGPQGLVFAAIAASQISCARRPKLTDPRHQWSLQWPQQHNGLSSPRIRGPEQQNWHLVFGALQAREEFSKSIRPTLFPYRRRPLFSSAFNWKPPICFVPSLPTVIDLRVSALTTESSNRSPRSREVIHRR